MNALQSSKAVALLLHKITRIHPERQIPSFPERSFFDWAATKGLTDRKEGSRNVAYFAGCTAGYLFPQVGQAVVEVLEHNGVTVYVPPQQCCGMPHLVEGDRKATLERVRTNMDLSGIGSGRRRAHLFLPQLRLFHEGAPSGKGLLYGEDQKSVNASDDEIKVPDPGRGSEKHKVLKKSMYKDILKDDSYFSIIDSMARIGLAEHLSDAGEYLARLHSEGRFDTRFNAIPSRMVYFAPCHQRELKIGNPYPELLALIPGLAIESLERMDCCGMGGKFWLQGLVP